MVIPSYQRAGRLRRSLEALAGQTLPAAAFEVIVVVDGSTDGTREALAGLEVPYALRVLWQENRGQNVARNRGAEAARGPYLVFLDDDIVAAPGLLAEHLRAQRSREGSVGIGRLELRLPAAADGFVRYFAEGWREHYGTLDSGERTPGWEDCFGGNLSVERSRFLGVGGFAEDVRRSHDIELGYRLVRSGAEPVYVAGALGYQDERKGIRDLAGDFRSAGSAYVELARRHPAMIPALVGYLAETSLRETILRHFLYLSRLPPGALGWLASWSRGTESRRRRFAFLQRYFYWSGVRRAVKDREEWGRLMRRTPILMYHAFGDGPSGSRFVVPARRFARQMRWLRRLGYDVIGLEEFLRHRRERGAPPRRSVVITIDDAYVDTMRHAYPVLRRLGYPATLFVVSERVGSDNTWSSLNGLRGRPIVGWDDLERMARDGIEVGAHTGTHPRLPGLPEEQVRREVAASKEELETRLRIAVRTFAYPYGESDPLSERVVRETGFLGACGVDSGLNTVGTPDFALRRIEIDGSLPLFRFLLALWTGHTHSRAR